MAIVSGDPQSGLLPHFYRDRPNCHKLIGVVKDSLVWPDDKPILRVEDVIPPQIIKHDGVVCCVLREARPEHRQRLAVKHTCTVWIRLMLQQVESKTPAMAAAATLLLVLAWSLTVSIRSYVPAPGCEPSYLDTRY